MIQILTYDNVNWNALGPIAREVSKSIKLENPYAYAKAVPHSVVSFSFLCDVDVYDFVWLSAYTNLKIVTLDVVRNNCSFILHGTFDQYLETIRRMDNEMVEEALAFYNTLYLVLRSTDLKQLLPAMRPVGNYHICVK